MPSCPMSAKICIVQCAKLRQPYCHGCEVQVKQSLKLVKLNAGVGVVAVALISSRSQRHSRSSVQQFGAAEFPAGL